MTRPLTTTTIAAHQPTSKTSARFRGSLLCVVDTTTITSHQPPPSLKMSHVCSFSSVVDSWHHHHPQKRAANLVFEGGNSLAPPHPRKRATYARFQGWLLLGSFLLQPTTTTTLHPRKRAHMLIFDGIINFFKYSLINFNTYITIYEFKYKTRTHTHTKPIPVHTGTGFHRYGYGFL
jgi:hypothetical protein